MYVCICARVSECELRAAVRTGARTEEAVGAACGAGTGCGTCLDRVCDLIMEEEPVPAPAGVTGPRGTGLRAAGLRVADTLTPAPA